jgi:nucleoid-associated protein YgaU
MTALRRTATVLRAVLAALVLLVLVAGVPLLLVVTVGNPIPDDWNWNSPLTNDAVLGVLAGVAWVFWAQLLVCVLIEFVAEIRIATGRSADWLSRVPGTFSGQQLLARTLVQAVVAVGLTSTAASAAVPVWPAHAEVSTVPAPDLELAHTPVPGPATQVESRSTAPTSRAPRESSTSTVVVAKGDTLWSIAEAHLGSGERWREIAELNEGHVMSAGSRFHDSGTILPGWELLVPAPAKGEDEVVTVRRGDSLWEIAEEEYGDGAEWPRIFVANRAVIVDPDEIYPGQSLQVPGTPATRVPTKQAPQAQPVDPGDPTGRPPSAGHQLPEEPKVEPTPQPTTGPVPPRVDEHVQAHAEGTAEPEETVPSNLIDEATIARALLGGGGLLAAGMLAVYATRRLTQSRNRRSGRVAPHVAPQLVAEEKALRAVGSSAGRSAAFFDAVLRELAQLAETCGIPLPEAAAARIDADRLELHLAEAAAVAPDPWLVSPDGSVWSVPSTHQPHATDRLSPYPTMITLGDDDQGGTWFVDLEAAGVVQVAGDRETAADVVRFVTAELALNPWMDADIVRVTGIAGELAPLNHGRLYPDDQPRVEELVKVARRMADSADGSQGTVLESRVLDGGADAWVPQVVVADIADIGDGSRAAFGVETRELLDEMERSTSRTSAALVCLTAESLDRRAVTLSARADGNLVTPWAVLRANRISAVEASVLTAMFDDAETEGDEPIPSGTGVDGEPGDTDLAGALVGDLTEQRCGTGDPRSVLPRPDTHYLESAATTAEDLQALAPAVPPSETSRAMAADSSLDADLGEWLDSASTRPKLRVLGPIELHAAGEKSKEVESRPAYFAELAAYLSSHPEGVTPSRAAADFGLQHNSLHTRLGSLRKWLGTKDGSDDWYLPEARRVRGQAVYRVEGLLCDADLFRRLRARGEARGPEGIEDLHRALELVAGRPFDQQRATGYGWLVDTPVDQYLTAGVVDVAHVVATHALAEGRPSVALWAAERAIAAAPSEDKPRLDLARARQAMGEDAEVERYLRHEVFNRSDDDRAPLDPSDRTRAVVDGFSGRRGGT